MFDLVNIFDTFLPQLLLYPNPSDPLNPNAAKMLKESPEKYDKYVRDHVKKNAILKIVLDKSKTSNTVNKNGNNNDNINGNGNNKSLKEKLDDNDNDNTKNNVTTKNIKEINNHVSDCNEDNKSVISEASVGDINDDNWD